MERPTYKCGHDVFPGMTDEQVGWQLEDMAAAMLSEYATIYDWIADVATQRCDACREAAIEAFTESVEYMDTPGPREA